MIEEADGELLSRTPIAVNQPQPHTTHDKYDQDQIKYAHIFFQNLGVPLLLKRIHMCEKSEFIVSVISTSSNCDFQPEPREYSY